MSAVKDGYRQGDRKKPISFVKSDYGRKGIKELIDWLNEEKELQNHITF